MSLQVGTDVRGVSSFAGTPDGRLVAAIAEGDESALTEAYERHSRAAYGAAVALLGAGGEAEDVVQDVFVRLWRKPDRFDPTRGTLRAFLKVDARGRALDALRRDTSRRRREDAQAVQQSSAQVVGTEEEAMTLVTSERVRAVLDRLEPNERIPIALAYFGGHSYRKVSELLALPEGTVKSRIRSGLDRLEGLLLGEGLGAA